MPYPMIVPTVIEVTLEGKVAAQQVMTVLHYRLSTTNDPIVDGRAMLEEIVTKLTAAAGLVPAWQACCSNDYYDMKGKVQMINPTRHAYVPFLIGGDVGTVNQPAMPSNVAFAITKRTDDVGVGQQGTIHMGGVPITFVEGSEMTPAGFTAYNTFAEKAAASLFFPGSGATWVPVIYHKAGPGLSPIWEDWIVQPTVRTMHRRTVGVGS